MQLWQQLRNKETKKPPGACGICLTDIALRGFSYPYNVDNFCTASADMRISQCSSRNASTVESAFSGVPYSESILQILLNSFVECSDGASARRKTFSVPSLYSVFAPLYAGAISREARITPSSESKEKRRTENEGAVGSSLLSFPLLFVPAAASFTLLKRLKH